MKSFIDIAYTAYCEEGDQFTCQDCDMCQYFEDSHYNPAICRAHLLELVAKEGKYLQELLKKEYFGKCKHCKHKDNCQIDAGHYNTANCYELDEEFNLLFLRSMYGIK